MSPHSKGVGGFMEDDSFVEDISISHIAVDIALGGWNAGVVVDISVLIE